MMNDHIDPPEFVEFKRQTKAQLLAERAASPTPPRQIVVITTRVTLPK